MGLIKKLLGIEAKALPVSVNDQNFVQEVLQSKLPVIVDVWSPSCGPCKKLEPVMMSLVASYAGRVKVCEMAVPNALRAAAELDVRSTPSVLYLRGGKELERVVGFRSSLYHQQTIEEVFGIPLAPQPTP